MTKTVFQILIIYIFFVNIAFAQKSGFQLGTQIPLMYSIGYEFDINNKFSFNTQVGILTRPYDVAILEILKLTGTEEPLVNTIGEAFSFGFIFQPTVKYCFKRYYIGAYYSYYSLNARETPTDAIENYYNIYLPDRINNRTNEFSLNSRLHNIGLLFGRKIELKNPNFELRLELAFAKTIKSKSKFSSESGDISTISSLIDDELNSYYINYGYLPSFNIFLSFKQRNTK